MEVQDFGIHKLQYQIFSRIYRYPVVIALYLGRGMVLVIKDVVPVHKEMVQLIMTMVPVIKE